MGNELSKADVQIIADDRIERYIDRFEKRLPEIMKPTIYECAEKVNSKNKTMIQNLFNVDLSDQKSIEEFQAIQLNSKENYRGSKKNKYIIKRATIIFFVGAILTFLGFKIGK
ncbi:MAG: hypothetical protein ACUZ8E_17885 [Candidatus Anammoxibacter sp.]